MERAQEGAVADAGASAVFPEGDVVGFSPWPRNRAAGKGTAEITGMQRLAYMRREQPGSPAKIQDLSLLSQHCRYQFSVAGELADVLSWDRAGECCES